MIPAIDIAAIEDELEELADRLGEAEEDILRDPNLDPSPLVVALREQLDDLRQRQARAEAQIFTANYQTALGQDITAQGDQAIDLLVRLAALAGRLRQPHLARDLEELAFPLAVWIARHEGEILSLATVVNAAAALANRLEQPQELAELHGLLREIGAALSPAVNQETGHLDPTSPWRVFLINRAIVATRSHQPALMKEAFEALTEYLPQEAPEFFREGMEQMEALNYPMPVRAVMEAWYAQWCERRLLH